MVGVAQLVRASDCGSECRGFDPRHPPPFHQPENIELYGLFELFTCFFPDFPLRWFRLISHGEPIIPATYLLQPPFAVNPDFSG